MPEDASANFNTIRDGTAPWQAATVHQKHFGTRVSHP